MNPTPDELISQISQLAHQLERHRDLAEPDNTRRALFDLTSALSSLTLPLDLWVTGAGEYSQDVSGPELTAPGSALKEAVRTTHSLLRRL